MNLKSILDTALPLLTAFGLKVLGAIVLWIVGRWLIGFAIRLTGNALERQKFDETLTRYLKASLRVVLNIVLVVALLASSVSRRRASRRCSRRVAWRSVSPGAVCWRPRSTRRTTC